MKHLYIAHFYEKYLFTSLNLLVTFGESAADW